MGPASGLLARVSPGVLRASSRELGTLTPRGHLTYIGPSFQVRLQVQSVDKPQYRGTLHCFQAIIKQESVSAWGPWRWGGAPASALPLPCCGPGPQGASLTAQLVKNPPAMLETPVQSLGQEDPLEKGKATHSRILGLPW